MAHGGTSLSGGVGVTEQPSRAHEVAQACIDEPVLAAAYCRPNVRGRFELSLRGWGDRQLMKAAGTYYGERFILAATPTEVCAVQVNFGDTVRPVVARWPRDTLIAGAVSACNGDGDPRRPAVLLAKAGRSIVAELEVRAREPEAAHLLALLLA